MKKSNVEQFLKKSLPKDSEDWLVACLDPFHDYQYEVHGLPDERCAPSVVQIHNKQYTLTAPLSAGGGSWDASVLFTGINGRAGAPYAHQGGMVTVESSAIHPYSSNSLNNGVPFGTLNLWAGAAGSTMSTGAPSTSGDHYQALNAIDSEDRCRVIGVAFEINNTTAEIYKQGSLTVAMLPDVACDSSQVAFYNTATSSTTTMQADRALIQACSLSPLMAVPGSSTWPAAQGAYVIPRMSVIPREIRTYGAGSPSHDGVAGRVPILYGTDGKTATPEPVDLMAVGDCNQALIRAYGPNGFTPIQVWLSGLSSQTSLTITLRVIVEYFPSLTSPLLPLASPSPVYDPKVLALYSAIASQAPYAVTVDQNSAGDYFRKVLKVCGTGLQLISPMFGAFSPLASAIGTAMDRGSELIPRGEAGPRVAQTGQKRRDLNRQVIKRPS